MPFTITDPGPDNVARTPATSRRSRPSTGRPAPRQDRVYTNPEGYDADFHTVEVALNRRMSGRWMLLTSAGMTWSKMQHVHNATTPMPTGYTRFYSFRPVDRLFGDEFGRETSTVWNYKVIGRYELPWGIGSSGSWRVQSGQNYGRTIAVTMPGDGARVFRVEPIDANRYPNVSIVDLRLDKSFTLPKQAGRRPALPHRPVRRPAIRPPRVRRGWIRKCGSRLDCAGRPAGLRQSTDGFPAVFV